MTIQKLVKGVLAAVLITFIGTNTVVAQGNAQAGEGKITVCLACHGKTGNDSLLPDVPKIGGQGERYLLKQLTEIKSGDREIPLMAGMLNAMNEQDLADIAAYFSALDAPLGAAQEDKVALGTALYKGGNAEIGVAACSACHAPNGIGNDAAGYPALGGQDPNYTEKQLRAFRASERMNDASSVMRGIAARLNDAEIAALASYVSGLR